MPQAAGRKKGDSFPSDRLPPRPASSPQLNVSSSGSGPANKKQAAGSSAARGPSKPFSKNKEVLRIEKLLKELRNSSGDIKDPKYGCFCLGVVNLHLQYLLCVCMSA
jgi:hypothetical protein